MTNKELGKFASELVDDLMRGNEKVIAESLILGVVDADPVDPTTMKIIINSVRLSTILAVQSVLACLDDAGLGISIKHPAPNLKVLTPESAEDDLL